VRVEKIFKNPEIFAEDMEKSLAAYFYKPWCTNNRPRLE